VVVPAPRGHPHLPSRTQMGAPWVGGRLGSKSVEKAPGCAMSWWGIYIEAQFMACGRRDGDTGLELPIPKTNSPRARRTWLGRATGTSYADPPTTHGTQDSRKTDTDGHKHTHASTSTEHTRGAHLGLGMTSARPPPPRCGAEGGTPPHPPRSSSTPQRTPIAGRCVCGACLGPCLARGRTPARRAPPPDTPSQGGRAGRRGRGARAHSQGSSPTEAGWDRPELQWGTGVPGAEGARAWGGGRGADTGRERLNRDNGQIALSSS
jgi:hypothetical protein